MPTMKLVKMFIVLMNDYQREVSQHLTNPLKKLWWWIGVKFGYFNEFWLIRMKYYLKLKKK